MMVLFSLCLAVAGVPSGAHFERNDGQAPATADFVFRGEGGPILIAASFLDARAGGSRFLVEFLGTAPGAQAEGLERLASHTSYYLGSDPRQWHLKVPLHGRVRYREVYPGVDLDYYATAGGQLEYDLVARSASALSRVRFRIDAGGFELEPGGGLAIRGRAGILRKLRPRAWQEAGACRVPVAARFVLRDGGEIGFAIEGHREGAPVTIDPVIAYSTYFGGSGNDSAVAVSGDGAGGVFVAGATTSADLPLLAAMQSTYAGLTDGWLARFGPTGQLIFSTYFGGGYGDGIRGVAGDANGNVIVVGLTGGGIPVLNAFQPDFARGPGGFDAFVAKLGPDGTF